MRLKSPFTRKDWGEFFTKMPVLILVLILVMLGIRFVITALFHWIYGG
jgi:hypothetical protein